LEKSKNKKKRIHLLHSKNIEHRYNEGWKQIENGPKDNVFYFSWKSKETLIAYEMNKCE
jgi:hypothetical protein